MRKTRKKYFIEEKKLLKTTIFSLLIAAVLLLSSSVMGIHIEGSQEKMNEKKVINPGEISTGLPPRISSLSTDLESIAIPSGESLPLAVDVTMYAYNAYASGLTNGPCYFQTETPGDITKLSENQVTNFLAGGTYSCDEKWLCVQYSTGVLYQVTTDTGEIIEIGGGGFNLNGLAFDPTSQLMYGAGDSALFYVNAETGVQELIGNFGGGSTYMIGIAFDADGVLYGWDLGLNYLWTIDTETGAATQVGPLGIDLNYAQDGDFDRENDVLYLTAFTLSPAYGGFLYTVDKVSGTATQVGPFEGSAELDASIVLNGCVPPEHDVGVKSIDLPADGPAYAPVDMQVTVKNWGNNSETTDVEYDIIKCEQGPALYNTDFSGTWPPTGWTYLGYVQSNSNKAGGVAPEAAYTYPPYVSQGWIMSPPINCTGFEKVNVYFRLYGDWYQPYYTPYFYLQYRKNASSAWRDASPWENPQTVDLGPAYYQIGCYGWGENIGEAFQARWYFGSYYYYLQYNSGIYLDDVQFYGCAGCAEYNDLVEDVEVPFDSEIIVDDFTKWTPSEWHNASYQNTWEDYPITTYTTLDDDNALNDKKTKLLHMYYPWLHDVGTMETGGPVSGPAQTFPMTATIQDTGQYDECCFKVWAQIAELDFDNAVTLLSQNFPSCSPWPPTGWTTTHPSNWQCGYHSYAGGTSPELTFYYYPSSTNNFRFMTPVIDSAGYGAIKIDFRHSINHYNGPYTLKVETSSDKISWSTVWEIVNPSSLSGTPVTITTGANVGGPLYISWTLSGNSYNINYWYIDNILIQGFNLAEPEYLEDFCISTIDVGETIDIPFPDWTPAFLDEETTGTKTYSYKVWTDMTEPSDNNHANDAIAYSVVLDFYHDVAVEVSAPVLEKGNKLIWDNGDTDGSNGYSVMGSLNRYLLDDFELTQSAKLSEFHCYMIYPYGNPTDWRLNFRADDGGEPGDIVVTTTKQTFSNTPTGRYWFGYAENELVYMFEPELLSAGIYWVEFSNGASDQNAFAMIRSSIWGSECWVNYPDYGGLMPGSYVFGVQADLSFQLWGSGGASVYVPLGNQDIEGLGLNFGTFPEYDMTGYADLYEFITNCSEATLAQSYMVDGIDILTPLTGTVAIPFGTYNFAVEGPYQLVLELVDDNDDDLDNNVAEWGIGADGTPPVSTRTLSPATPDGDNNWYVSDLTVTLDAADPAIGCDWSGAGVKEIKYTWGSHSGTISGEHGTFTIDEDGNDIKVEYWAIDNVGNAESKHTFYIDMDQTKPEVPEVIAYTYEKIDNFYYVTFNVTCTDETSIMDRVEWAINDVVQTTVEGSGPVYTWTIQWSEDLHKPTITFKATAYDTAGNNDFVTLIGADVDAAPLINLKSVQQQQQQQQQQKN